MMKTINRPLALIKTIKSLSRERLHRAKPRTTTALWYGAKRFIAFTKRSNSLLEGFTLLEMVVSMGLFAVVIVISIGAVLGINSAQIKAANTQTIQDNLRFALESVTKEMRTGKDFRPVGSPAPEYQQLTFTRSDGVDITYCLRDAALRKITGGTVDCSLPSALAVTDGGIVIERLVFYVIGQAIGTADGQPRVTVSLQARSRDPKLAVAFKLQTTITQRSREE